MRGTAIASTFPFFLEKQVNGYFSPQLMPQLPCTRHWQAKNFNGDATTSSCSLPVPAEIAKAKAETEFEKYRVIQDRLFMSDFDKYMLELEENAKK